MRAIYPASSGSSLALQVVFVILTGLTLAWLVFNMPSALPVALVLGGVLLLGFLRRPDLGLLAILLVRSSMDATLRFLVDPAFGTVGPEGALLTPNLGILIVLIVGGGIVVIGRRFPFISLPGGILFVLLLITGLFGVLRSESLMLSVDQWAPALGALIAYALAANLFSSPAQMRKVIDVLAASFILPAVFGLFQLATGQGSVLRDIGVSRVQGTFVQANPFGLYLVMILSVFVNQFLVQRGTRKFVALLIVAVGGVLLVASFARFAWVGLAIVLLTVSVLRSRVLLLILPLILIFVLVLVPSIGERFSDPLGGSFADRVGIWRSLLLTWESLTNQGEGPISVAVNRLSGLGPGSSLMLVFGFRGTHPHNDYIRIFVEYGAFGLLLYLVLFAVLILTAFRTWRHSSDDFMRSIALSFLGLALAYPVMSITAQMFGLMANQLYFWTLAGLTVAVARFRVKEQPVSRQWQRDAVLEGIFRTNP